MSKSDKANTATASVKKPGTTVGLSTAPPPLPLVLAGPIVRLATENEVWFWFATSKEITSCKPKLVAYNKNGRPLSRLSGPLDNGVIPLAASEQHITRLGERLWIALVSAKPASGKLPAMIEIDTPEDRFPAPEVDYGRAVPAVTRDPVFIGYDIAFTYDTGSQSTRVKLSELKLGISYPAFQLPTFVLGDPASRRPRFAHGSCRRPGAPEADAYGVFDPWLAGVISNAAERPSALFLTGDQIYADDVAEPLFKAVQKLAGHVFDYVEVMPSPDGGTAPADQYPAVYQKDDSAKTYRDEHPHDARFGHDRKWLTGVIKGKDAHLVDEYTWAKATNDTPSPIGFTTDDGEGHLLSFPEFAAMYLLVLNSELCSKYSVDDGSKEELKDYPRAVAAARRVLANVATYMVLDDHEISDDWNMDEEWVTETQGMNGAGGNAMARRIIANGLAAAWAFQAWGNDPHQFASFITPVTDHLDQVRAGKGRPGSAAAGFDKALLQAQWSFVAPTDPPALCFDTRTRREFPKGKTAVLSGPKHWPDIKTLSDRHRLKRETGLLVVLATPLLPHRIIVKGQEHAYPYPSQRYQGDYEFYPNNSRQRAELISFLHDLLNPPELVIFSGDYHFGSVVDGFYAHGASSEEVFKRKIDWGMRVVQVTSSPIKNVADSKFKKKRWWTAWQTDAGNVGESVVPLWERQYTKPPLVDGTTIGMVAIAQKLSGKLGRETFIYENHFCIVDMPWMQEKVSVLFVGAKDGGSATATTEVGTRNDIGSFFKDNAGRNPGWWAPDKPPPPPMPL